MIEFRSTNSGVLHESWISRRCSSKFIYQTDAVNHRAYTRFSLVEVVRCDEKLLLEPIADLYALHGDIGHHASRSDGLEVKLMTGVAPSL